MALNYTQLTTDVYNSDLFNLLKNVEGAITNAYLDTQGLPTIGIGFNIKGNPDIRNDVLTLFGLDWNASIRLFPNLTPAQRAAENFYIAQINKLLTTAHPANPTKTQSQAFGDALNLIMIDRWNNLISQLSPADQAKTRPQFSFVDNTDMGEMRPIFVANLPTYEKKAIKGVSFEFNFPKPCHVAHALN